jgi:hypothetical protein
METASNGNNDSDDGGPIVHGLKFSGNAGARGKGGRAISDGKDIGAGNGSVETSGESSAIDGGSGVVAGVVSADGSGQGDASGGNGEFDGGRSSVDSGGIVSGSGEGSEIGNVSGNRRAKRGRHPNDCDCERCAEKRDNPNATVRVKTGRAPRNVSYDSLAGEKDTIAKGVEQEAISIALTVLFEAPKFMAPAGTADHWPLDNDEEKALIKRIQDVVNMLPKRKKTAAMKFIGKIMPPLALVTTGYMLVTPRVKLTRALILQQQTNELRNARIRQEQATAATEPSVNGNNATARGNNGPATQGDGGNRSSARRAIDGPFVGS